MRDVAGAEYARRETHQRTDDEEDGVDVIDEEIERGLRAVRVEERSTAQREGTQGDVEGRRVPVCRDGREKQGTERGSAEESGERDRSNRRAHADSPRAMSSACRSTVSNRSRMRNRKIPTTRKAMRTENPTLISTTSGMPRAPVAASTRPFSSDMNPMTWLTAFRRATIIRNPRSTTDSAKARSSRTNAPEDWVISNMTTTESATRAIPNSMVGPMLTTVSIVR